MWRYIYHTDCSCRVEGGQVQPAARKMGSNTPNPPNIIVPAPDPTKQCAEKSVKPISEVSMKIFYTSFLIFLPP